jgi:hypothetical protein
MPRAVVFLIAERTGEGERHMNMDLIMDIEYFVLLAVSFVILCIVATMIVIQGKDFCEKTDDGMLNDLGKYMKRLGGFLYFASTVIFFASVFRMLMYYGIVLQI